MWNGLFMLLSLSIVMAVASFLAGALPLSFALSPRQLRLVTAIGTGVLVGTSLIVIIPEGVETLYSAREIGNARSVPIPKSVSSPAWRPPISEDETRRVRRDYADVIEVRQVVAEPDDEEPEYPGLPYEPVVPEEPESQMVPKKKQKSEKETWEPHAWIGISVILGFILMYLIDHVPRHATSDYQPKPSHISLNSFNLRRSDAQEGDEQNGNAGDAFTPPEEEAHSTRPSSTTVGLVIHAAADGIALGASASGSSTRLGFIVFLALMVHKAPAAFGLTSALLKQGLSKRRVRTHLVIFSLAAPVGALTTWVITNLFGGGLSGSEEGTQFATGVLLLFSGGTFLYVAMHTMQDSNQAHMGYQPRQNGYSADSNIYGGYQSPPVKQEGPTIVDTLAAVGGMLLPLLTQFGHVH